MAISNELNKYINNYNILCLFGWSTILNTLIYNLIQYFGCSIGISGTIISIEIYSYKYIKNEILFGKNMDRRLSIMIRLLIFCLIENVSHVGHFIGFIVGLFLYYCNKKIYLLFNKHFILIWF